MSEVPERCEVAVIGSGFSGLGVAINLKRCGIEDFVILERAESVGGTWRDNVYPGCAVDVPSVLYSYSFFPGDWSRLFATQPELRAYTESVVDAFDLRRHVRRESEVVGAEFDESEHRWRVRSADGRVISARAVVMGYFSLHVPFVPDVPGRELFRGVQMHSGSWHSGFQPEGKRIAVVGSGASAVQIVPALARAGAQVVSFQRSPAWVLPRGDRAIPGPVRTVLREFPPARLALRGMVFSLLELVHLAEFHPRLLPVFEQVCLRALRRQVPDPRIREKLRPDYRFGCKRPMVSDEYYAAFARDDVDLVTEKIVDLTPSGVRTADGVVHEVDAIVWATGYHVQDSIPRFPDFRTAAFSLRESYERNGFAAYRGIAFAGLPNLFCVTGPNTALPHTSQFQAIEPTTRLIARTIAHMRERAVTRYTPTDAAQHRFVAHCRRVLADRVWTIGGCTSYFVTPTGTNTLTWPGSTRSVRRDRRHIRPEDWDRRPATAESSTA
ncbi:flavin-containing monooxygenase [Nocardia bhagyanarayanae]|uniref:Cation diffusion facilitator CzcD-associated flavoprotein CzcO n=1 Tax=Nocardia bhagyanarayanae TaxID=1215925 RepID=A0A543FD97_9NOCA|nr:NAD(P)/FAD-dependent oxidoreductase [Nocardia bhagyanarayanae]TQM31850.1 cation diffusion facilitator CzcD-associated flavoprotein CzcO [Nocardia bhagyanarayanae]